MKTKLSQAIRGSLLITLSYMVLMTVIGIIPYVYLGTDFWMQNGFLTVVGLILGLASMVMLFVLAIGLSNHVNPYAKWINYMSLFVAILLLFIIQFIVLDDESIMTTNARIIVFEASLALIVLIHGLTYLWLKRQSYRAIDASYQSYLKDHTIDPAIGGDTLSFLVYYVIIALIGSPIFMDQMNSLIDYAIIAGAYNIFFFYKIVTIFNYNKRRRNNYLILSLGLFIISLSLFTLFIDFFTTYTVVRAVLIILPIAIYLPRLFKMHYILLWKTTYQSK